jgi:photosystem II stability/assembly factor-like uncharacterized protein
MDALEPAVPSRRKRRALALAAGAAIAIIAASLVYLRQSAPAPTPAPKPFVNAVDANIDFMTYDFPSPMVAWAFHHPQNGAVEAGKFSVSRTLDGGRTWQVRMKGEGSYGGGVTVRFFDEQHGFVAVLGFSPQLYRTSDGGGSWIRLSLPVLQVAEAVFIDAGHGWLVVRPLDRDHRVYLFSTEDGGDSWRRLPDPPNASSGLAARGPTEAWLASGLAPARVYRSVDGGLSWQSRELPRPAIDREFLVGPWQTFVRALPGIGVYASAQCDCLPNNRLDFTSFDGGATWRPFTFMPGVRPFLTAFQDDSHWWSIDARTLRRTSDAGQTWTKVSDQLPDWEFQPRAIDMTHAWARLLVVGGYGLARTEDAGLHWTRVKVPQST